MTRPFLPRLDEIELHLAELTGARVIWQLLAVGLVSLLLFLPGFFVLPVVDRDEARFSQASRQMVGTGDLIDIRLGEDTRYKKPVGIYWLQSAAAAVAGPDHAQDIWVYRIPSLIGAVAAVMLTYLVALSLSGATRVAFVAALCLSVTLVLAGEARIAKTDAVLLATVLGAQLVLARLWMRGAAAMTGAWPWAFWAILGLSMLIKGPVGPMVVGLTVLALSLWTWDLRWLAPLRPRAGLILFLALVLPWYIAITIKSGSAFWAESLGRDLLGKIGEGEASKGAPPGTYALAVWATFWPAAILLPFGLAAAWRDRAQHHVQFLIAWILPSWIVFELTATKLVHYVLPTFPALAVLCALGWLGRDDRRPGPGYTVFLCAMLGLGGILLAVPLVFAWPLGQRLTLIWVVGAAILLAGVWFTWNRMRAGDRLAPVLGFALMTAGLATALFGHLARTPALWPSNRLADIQAATPMCDGAAYASIGYHEASILLLTDPRVRLLELPEGLTYAQSAPCALVFVGDRQREAFDAAADDRWSHIDTVTGMNLGNTRNVTVHAYRRN
ncbi:MAG: glycosyltransferase family 39 protein [Marinibacterium sp.]|nr:glycosyltransferase family 39 protein [Marinibacterium sp.]